MSSIDNIFSQLERSKFKGLLYSTNLNLYFRDRGDVGIFLEQKEWEILPEEAQGVILDLGSHCGYSTWFFQRRGLQVIPVEPDPQNIRVFKKNFPSLNLIERAVTNQSGETLPLYLGKTYSAKNSLFEFRGRDSIDVGTISFRELLQQWNPNVIKCDIEGGEYLLDWSNLPKNLQYIVMELHYNRPDWEEKSLILDQTLINQGFKYLKPPRFNSFKKTCTAGWWR